MSDSKEDYSEGDTVTLTDTHHMHNSELKKNEGRNGEVISIMNNKNKLLVEFEGTTKNLRNRFWINPKWLEPTTQD